MIQGLGIKEVLMCSMVLIISCKGDGERVDLSKKTAKCSKVFDEDILPMLEERMMLKETLEKIYESSPSSSDKEVRYCNLVVSQIDSSQKAIANSQNCHQLAEQSFEYYGGCSQYNQDVEQGCSDEAYEASHALNGFSESKLHPSIIISQCELILAGSKQ